MSLLAAEWNPNSLHLLPSAAVNNGALFPPHLYPMDGEEPGISGSSRGYGTAGGGEAQ